MEKAGRKTKAAKWRTPDGLITLEGMAREGAIDRDIAKHIGISKSTLIAWKTRYPEIGAALEKGKAPVDFKVENKLLESALGFTVTVKKPVKVRETKQLAGKGKIETEKIEYVQEEVFVPPNITAQIFWLKNRKPEQWREKRDVEPPKILADDPLMRLLGDLNEQAKADK